jgi:soluble lytic murein transglycosylase-like protein
MRRLLARAPLAVLALLWGLAASRPANLGAMVAPEVRSGELVLWVPDEIGSIELSLLREIGDPVEAAEIAQIVHSESRALDLDPLFALALMKIESGFRADAVSPRGAIGLLQVRPVAARAVARGGVRAAARLADPRTNVAIGLRYLRKLERQFPDRVTALAAYNLGPTRVRSRLARREPVPRAYARRVLAAYRALQDDRDC